MFTDFIFNSMVQHYSRISNGDSLWKISKLICILVLGIMNRNSKRYIYLFLSWTIQLPTQTNSLCTLNWLGLARTRGAGTCGKPSQEIGWNLDEDRSRWCSDLQNKISKSLNMNLIKKREKNIRCKSSAARSWTPPTHSVTSSPVNSKCNPIPG